jgi:hypothetical protein
VLSAQVLMHVGVLDSLIDGIQMIESSFTILLFDKIAQGIKVFDLFCGFHVPVSALNFIFSIGDVAGLLVVCFIFIPDFPICLY